VGRPAGDLKEAKVEDFNPNGSTAMRDAMGYTVQKLLDTDDGNTAYLVYVISDGQTNADSHYVPRFNEATGQTEDVLKDLLTGVQATGRWTITYMGCSQTVPRSCLPFNRCFCSQCRCVVERQCRSNFRRF
jgi:hypothetical protein